MKDGNTVDGDEDEYEYIAESEQRRGRGQLPNPNARYQKSITATYWGGGAEDAGPENSTTQKNSERLKLDTVSRHERQQVSVCYASTLQSNSGEVGSYGFMGSRCHITKNN